MLASASFFKWIPVDKVCPLLTLPVNCGALSKEHNKQMKKSIAKKDTIQKG
jgi:hypothetical protein